MKAHFTRLPARGNSLQKKLESHLRSRVTDPTLNTIDRRTPLLGGSLPLPLSRDTYFDLWKESAKRNAKSKLTPARSLPVHENTNQGFNELEKVLPGSSTMDPRFYSLRQKISRKVNKLRLPQLHEFFSVGEEIGRGREGIVRLCRPCGKQPSVMQQDESKMYENGHGFRSQKIVRLDSIELLHTQRHKAQLHKAFECEDAAVKTVQKDTVSSSASGLGPLSREVQVFHSLNEFYKKSQETSIKPCSAFQNSAHILHLQESRNPEDPKMNQIFQFLGHKHPNIIEYLYTFESPIRWHIMTELLGRDLFSFLEDRDFEPMESKTLATMVLKLLSGVKFLNMNGWIHMDIKLENIMIREGRNKAEVDNSYPGELVLIDFGHAARLREKKGFEGKLIRPVGSASYAAPEVILRKRFYQNSDMWSVGVVLHILLHGYLPFPHLQNKHWREFTVADYGDQDENNPKIEENDPFSPLYDGDWAQIEPEARDLCHKLLTLDSSNRIDIDEAMRHPWFEKYGLKVKLVDGMPLVEQNSSDDDNGAQRAFA